MNETPEPDNAPVDAALASLEPGFLVGNGRFTLVRLIGRGGMGVVWQARDESLREDVALKFLPTEIRFDAVALDDLRRETARARKLTHPNIIRIHDLVKDEREAFISMEFIDGSNLSDLRLAYPERVFTWEFLEPLVRQLCDALDYAHGEKVVHRDLKPANLMLDSRGRLKLSDFGIAAQVSDSVSQVSMIRHGQSGTVTYMSPQQMDGKLPQVTDDIYALGATLYELLTSRPPFFTGDIAHQVRNLSPQPMAERLSELGLENPVPSPVAAMIMACLGKSPGQRPQTARAVAEWIGLPAATSVSPAEKIVAAPPGPKPAEQRKASVAPVAPKPPTTLEPAPFGPDTAVHEELTSEPIEAPVTAQTREPARTNTSLLIAAVIVLMIASLGTGAALWWFFRSRTESKPDVEVANAGDATAPAANLASTADRAPRVMVPANGWFAGATTLSPHKTPIADLAFSADGRWFVSVSADAVLRVHDAASGQMVSERTVGSSAEVKAIAILPGEMIAAASVNGRIEVLPLATGTAKSNWQAHDSPVLDLATAAGWLVSGDQNGRVKVWNAANRSLVAQWMAHPGGVRSLAIDPNGRWVVTGGKDAGLHAWSLPRGDTLALLNGHRDEIRSVAVSPDGELIASTSRDRSLRLWRTSDWKLKRAAQWNSDANWNFGVAFANDSRFVAAGGPRGRVYVYDVETAARGKEKQLAGLSSVVHVVTFSPDGSVIIGGDETGALRVWRFSSGKSPPPVTAATPATPQAWQTLFDGTSLDAWQGWKGARWIGAWTVMEQELHSLKGGTIDLATREQFGDFELELEWKVQRGANSGILYRARPSADVVWKTAPEYQIIDDATVRDGKNSLTSAGSLYGVIAPVNKNLKPSGEFNASRILVRGSKVEHWLNGVKILEGDLDAPESRRLAQQRFNNPAWGKAPSGYIVLQHLGNEVSFRNIRVRRLE